MKENLCEINAVYAALKSKFVPHSQWYTAYDAQPQLLANRLTLKMDAIRHGIDRLGQSLSALNGKKSRNAMKPIFGALTVEISKYSVLRYLMYFFMYILLFRTDIERNNK